MPPREPRERVRQRLLDAAAKEFARRGVDGTSVAAVASAAGLTKGAVYSNFRSKEALVDAVIDANQTAVDPASLLDADRPLAERLDVFGRAVAATLRGTTRRQVLLDRALQTYRLSHPRAMARYRKTNRDLAAIGGVMLEAVAERRNEMLPLPGRQFVELLMALTRGLIDAAVVDPDLLQDDHFAEAFVLLADPGANDA